MSARARAELLFVGAMHRDANVDAVRWFHDEILPRVRAEVGEVRFTIAGASPPAEIQRLAASPGVEVTGFVESLEPFYARATVFVAPLRIAGGIAGKTLDALAAGCPVVTTTLGNDGIGATPGQHLLVADASGGLRGGRDTAASRSGAARAAGRERATLRRRALRSGGERRGARARAPGAGRRAGAHQAIRRLTTLQ